ncbi:ABC transporter permease [Williamsoniiplasma somnilux]|uniref:ABC transporter permease n=1 Tax=Williamsoniiplasma somnilux TaxID=215578 RepID=A0A2K8NXX7_9MOLU|nr:hypothetical protein [Williamsoniiplasma somnilux]ATZ18670.1 ABC transporter permease [Williamsoniiplasma somnilux]
MKNTFIILGRLWKVQAVNYFKDVTNITLGVIMTSLTMICWIAFKTKEGGLIADPFVLASAMGISAISNSQYNFNLTLTDWRFKGFFRTFSSTPVSKTLVFLGILMFNWFINLLVALVLFSLAMIFQEQRVIVQYVNWPIFILGFVLNVLLSNVIAIALTFVWKRRDVILVLSLLSYFGPMYLLGLGLPWNLSGNVKWLNDFLYLWPHRYTLSIIQSGWIWGHTPNFMLPIAGDPTLPGGVEAGSLLARRGLGMNGQLWIPVLVSLVWISIFLGLIYLGVKRKFSFGRRGLKTYKGINKHFYNISLIKRAKSITEMELIIKQIKEETNNTKALNEKNLKEPNKKIGGSS